ncbi:MAG: hypothetical protein HY303_16805, partial [Candidatus Wallbacteria bacterium]|nr:hypothetical protein [Candidatus Wallbacteria bacterium]
TPKAAAATGRVAIGAGASGFDGFATVSDPALTATTSFVLETPAILSVVSVTALPFTVSRGQTVPVTVSVANVGQATAIVAAVYPTFFSGTASRSGDYTTNPAPVFASDNPDRIAGGQRGTYRFLVDVGRAATVGQVTLHATAAGFDADSGVAVATDTRADTPDSWTVQTPATLALLAVAGPGTRISSGRSAGVTLTLRNAGQAAMNLTTVVFSFTGAGSVDRTLEYAVVPRARNAAQVAGGSSTALSFDITPSAAATVGQITLAATIQGTDSNSGTPFTTSGSGSVPSFTLERPAGLSLVAIAAASSRVSRGQTVGVTVTLQNTGGAAAAATTATLSFATAGGDAGADYRVTPAAGNPTVIDGNSFAQLGFRVAVATGASTGVVTVTAQASGRDANSGERLSAAAAGVTTAWTVERPAALAVAGLTASPATVQRGTSLSLTLTVRNAGDAPLVPGAATFTFNGPSDVNRSSEYTVTPSSLNPASIPGGASRDLRFTAVSSARATTGTLTVAASIDGKDANSLARLSAATTVSQRPSFRLGFLTALITRPAVSDLLFDDEPVTCVADVREDTGARVSDSAISWTADGFRIGTGASIVAPLAAGSHSLELSATTASGLTSGARSLIQVLGPQPAVSLLIVGGTVRTSGGTALGAGISVTVRNLTKGLTVPTFTAQGGIYTAVFSSGDGAVASMGDALSVSVRDAAGLPRTVTPAAATVMSRDLRSARKPLDLALTDLLEIRVKLDAGLNLVSFPAQPLTSSGTYDTGTLLRDTGATFVARVPASGIPSVDHLILQDASGLVSSGIIEASQAYLLSVPAARTVALKGAAWPAGSRSRLLVRGRNLVGLPAGVPIGASSQTLGDTVSSDTVTRTRPGASGTGEFETWVRGGATFPLSSGKGYIVVPRHPGVTVQLPGAP